MKFPFDRSTCAQIPIAAPFGRVSCTPACFHNNPACATQSPHKILWRRRDAKKSISMGGRCGNRAGSLANKMLAIGLNPYRDMYKIKVLCVWLQLTLTGLAVMCFARRKNRYSYLVSLRKSFNPSPSGDSMFKITTGNILRNRFSKVINIFFGLSIFRRGVIFNKVNESFKGMKGREEIAFCPLLLFSGLCA